MKSLIQALLEFSRVGEAALPPEIVDMTSASRKRWRI